MKGFGRRIQESSRGPTTYVAEGSKITGTLTGKGAYVFCGEVDGDCDIDGPVTLSADGRWHGTLKATHVIIAGLVEGDVVAEQRVEVAGTARIAGSLTGQSIAVAEGAVIEGQIRVTSGDAPKHFKEKRKLAIDTSTTAA